VTLYETPANTIPASEKRNVAPTIEDRGLVKRFRNLLARDDLDFRGPVRPDHGVAPTERHRRRRASGAAGMTVTLDSTIDGTAGSHTRRCRVLAPPMSAGAAAPTGMVVVSVTLSLLTE
jgi:hypothetical protein